MCQLRVIRRDEIVLEQGGRGRPPRSGRKIRRGGRSGLSEERFREIDVHDAGEEYMEKQDERRCERKIREQRPAVFAGSQHGQHGEHTGSHADVERNVHRAQNLHDENPGHKTPAPRGDISEEGHFSPARHNSPDPQQDAATHKQVQHAQWKEHAFTGDAVKLTPHDKAEGKEKCGAQKIYGTFFHWNLPEVIFDRLSRLCIPSRWNTREKAA